MEPAPRRRRRVLRYMFVAMAFLCIAAGIWIARTTARLSDRLQALVEREFAALADGRLRVGGVSWHWGYVDFTNVVADAPMFPGEVRVMRVRVRFGFRPSLHFVATDAIECVELLAPVLALDDSLPARVRRWSDLERRKGATGRLPDLAITFREGAILYRLRAKDAKTVPILHDLTGWAKLGGTITAAATARALRDSTNLFFTAYVPRDTAAIPAGRNRLPHVRAVALSMALSRLDGTPLPAMKGVADLYVEWRDSLAARFIVRRAEILPKGRRPGIGPVTTALDVSSTRARWEPTEIALGGLIMRTAGIVRWDGAPRIDATGQWEGEIETLADLLGPTFADYRGDLRGEISVVGPLAAPVARLDVASDSIAGPDLHLDRIALRAHTEPIAGATPDRVVIDEIGFRVEGTRVSGNGAGRLRPLDLSVRLESEPLAIERIRALAERGIAGSTKAAALVHVRGAQASIQVVLDDIRASWDGRPIPIDRATAVRDSGGGIRFSATGPAARAEGRVALGSDTLRALDATVYLADYIPPVGDGAPHLTGECAIEGAGNRVSARGTLTIAPEGRRSFSVDVEARARLDDGAQPFVARVSTAAFPFATVDPDIAATIARSRDGWDVSGAAWGNRLAFDARISDDRAYSAALTLRDAPVKDLAALVHIEGIIKSGEVGGRLAVAGKIDDAKSHRGAGKFRIDRLELPGGDSLAVAANLSVAGDTLRWESGPILDGETPLAQVTGSYVVSSGAFATHIVGTTRGRMERALAMLNIELPATGDADWSVNVTDSRDENLRIAVDIYATRGDIVTIPFDTLRARLDGDARWLTLTSGALIRSGRYRFASEGGRIPIGAEPDAELDIPVRILATTGGRPNDVLGLITDLIDMDVRGEGPGEGYVRIGGPPETPVAGEGWIEVHDGTLTWPGKTWPVWRDVRGRVSVVPEGRFLRIDSFSARVGDGVVTARNIPAESIGADPLTIDIIGLSLGVVEVETPRPIPLHVPGGMAENQSVRLTLRGLGERSRFVIAGPWENPLFHGEIVASDGYFTFPIEEIDLDPDTSGTDFFSTIDWQADIVVGRNLYYETRPSSRGIWRRFLRDPLDLIGSFAVEMEARLVEGGRIHMEGIYGETGENLNIITEGIYSEQARMSVLDLDFIPDGSLVFTWDTRTDPEPLIRGRGVATLGDSTGSRIYARLVSTDPVSGRVREGGRLGELTVELDSDDIFAARMNAQERQFAVLEMLGYRTPDPANSGNSTLNTGEIMNAGYRTLLRRSEMQAWRSLFSPFQRQVRRLTRIDVLDVRPSILLNLVDETQPRAQFAYLRGTNWTVGRYLWSNLLFSYHGELELTSIFAPTLGARHDITIEWALSPKTRIQLRRDIDVPVGVPDTRIGLTHRFAFQPY